MAASIGVLDTLTVASSELVNEPRRGERRSLRNDNCAWLAGAAALAAREKEIKAVF